MSQRYYMTSLGRIPTGPSIPITASDGDFIMLRYEWPGILGGRDADTFTGIEPGTGTNVDGIKNASGSPTRYVGYAGATTIGPSADINNSGCYFYFGGDNVQNTGQEVVIIRPKSIASANPSITTFRVGIYLNWFSAIGIGCMNFVMRVYSGGSFTVIGGTSKEITSSGTLLRTYTFSANTNNQNNPNTNKIGYPSNGINGYAQIGIFTFSSNGNGIFTYNLSAVGNCGTTPAPANFGTGFNSTVFAIQLQPDGKILVGGSFTSYNGISSNRIIRLNSDASIDTSFNIGTGLDFATRSIAVQSDSKIIAGGSFSSYNGTSSNNIIRLNASGSVDTSFSIGTGFNNGNGLYVIVLQPDGKILAGGSFSSYNGTSSNNIIRLNTNGSIDTSFSIGTGFNGHIWSIAIQLDGKILMCGAFSSYNGTSSNNIIRLNTNGSIDTSFNAGTGFGVFPQSPVSIIIQPDGKILVGGSFTSYNGTSSNRIIRLNTNGSIDTSFSIGTGFNATIGSIALQSDGKIIAVGEFTSYNGTSINRIIRLNTNGSIDTSFNVGTGLNDSAWVVNNQVNDYILVGGSFTSYNGNSANRIIQLNMDGVESYLELLL